MKDNFVVETSDFPDTPTWQKLYYTYRLSEEELLKDLVSSISLTNDQKLSIREKASYFIQDIKAKIKKGFSFETFLKTYDLTSKEGLALMCLAEALLRIPDKETRMHLIQDKIGGIEWERSKADNLFMNLATLGLATTEHLLKWGFESKGFFKTLTSLASRLSTPLIREVVVKAMHTLGKQFVLGETIEQALKNAKARYCYSFDMLGEAAKTQEDAERYLKAYVHAIQQIGSLKSKQRNGISIKLSALHPRYEVAQRERVLTELTPLVLELCQLAACKEIPLTIDAEESERLTLSLEILEKVASDPSLKGWDGLGLAVQAYQKRALSIIDFVIDLAKRTNRRFSVRLVKGAYWDSEIKRTQEKGLKDYSTFTRKPSTDVSYLACVQKMLHASCEIYPQFATHNAYTVATILVLGKYHQDFEFQRLHGMGEDLYEIITQKEHIPCRIYAPVGIYKDLLAYLARRILENGANSSFVHQLDSIPIESLIEDPLTQIAHYTTSKHPEIPLPLDLLKPLRQNSKGIDLSDYPTLSHLKQSLEKTILPPSPSKISVETVEQLFQTSEKGFKEWSITPVSHRVQCLEKLAYLLEENKTLLIKLLIQEGKKTIPDAVSETREAIDFCYYYGQIALELMSCPKNLLGPTGEKNELSLAPRGIFVAISPWNFPLAIFLGQVVAALVTGNTVLAKPSQQTPCIASVIIQLAYQAGIPKEVLQLAYGPGSTIGQALIEHPLTAGVVFTGSTSVARSINQTLAQKEGPLTPFIAETGGINAMIMDSSALLEQVTTDIITSAFQSAGQRCSALRLLFIQDDIKESFLIMLKGAMAELNIGQSSLLKTDVGPVIDEKAQKSLFEHMSYLNKTAKLIYKCDVSEDNTFVPPQAWLIEKADDLKEEVFGPLLHIISFKGSELLNVIHQINNKGYGLTMGLHTRLDSTIDLVRKHAQVGNLYVNRNMIGAVVGVQPFGGEKLSGTGPKAGGPYYLLRFLTERTFTQDTTVTGGNATLLSLEN